MKRLLFSLLLMISVAMLNAAKREFAVAASNVDGLPPSVKINYGVGSTEVKMNPDGSTDKGATRMGELFLEKGWDIIGLSEDFNYHNYLISPMSSYYNASTYRGKIEQENLSGSIIGFLSQSVHMDTDGLCLLTRKKSKVLEEQIVSWNTWHGYTDNESDGLIDKGYRFYQICLEGNLTVDVYIMHMDAGSTEGDITARTSQIQQLAAAIIASDNKNPIIILGDMNCRYTRDTLKTDLIDSINSDSRFEIHDPWVDFQWNGVYPTYGTESLMVGTYGEQKGEVVDKVFYINNSDSQCTLTCNGYLHDDSFTYADGSQISDHYPVVANLTIEGPDSSDKNEFEIPEAPVKGAVSAGNTYYLRNLASGEFIRAGGAWTTQAVMGDYGTRITLEAADDKFLLSTPHNNNGSHYINFTGSEYYMDQPSNAWILTQVTDNIYILTDASGNTVGHNGSILTPVSNANLSDKNVQWEFLTDEDLIHELYYAKSSAPKDATFLMKTADFGYCDKENGWTIDKGNNSKEKIIREDNPNNISVLKLYNDNGYSSSNRNWNLSQTIENVPAGTYKISYQLLTYNLGDNHKFTINGTNAEFTNVSSDPGELVVAQNLAKGLYEHEVTITVTNEGEFANKIAISVVKSATKSATGAYYDNFKIKCIGLEGMVDIEVYDRVRAALDDAYEKAGEIGVALNNTSIEKLWANKEIAGDGWEEIKRIYSNLSEAVLKIKTLPADYTYALINPSFELYPDYKNSLYNISGSYPFGWDYPVEYSYDSGVWPATDSNKKTDNPDGEYIYNTWDNDWGGFKLTQKVSLSPGIYELSALVASNENNNIFIFAGDNAASAITKGGNTLVPVKFNFKVMEGAPLELGVVGGLNDGSYTMDGGQWYKVDNFHLKKIGDSDMITGLEKVQLAINDATTKSETLGKKLDLSSYQTRVDTYSIKNDGEEEFIEIYDLLRSIIYENKTENADYTAAIINNSFEWGNYYGWNIIPSNDTNVYPNDNDVYHTSNCDGNYLFNTWSQGTPINQIINNLPAGRYKLSALAVTGDTSDPRYVYLMAGDNKSEAIQVNVDKTTMSEIEFEFDVTETSDIKIGIVGANEDGSYNESGGFWYKVDNFRLTYLGTLEQSVLWTMEGSKYDTLILPFDAEVPENIEAFNVYETNGKDYTDYHVLSLVPADMIVANTPYIIQRVQSSENPVSPLSLRSPSLRNKAMALDDNSFSFTGVPENEGDEYTEGLLTGTLKGKTLSAASNHYVLTHDSENSYFRQHSENSEVNISANHAYIAKESAANLSKSALQLEEPNRGENTGIYEINANEIFVDVFSDTGIKVRSNVSIANPLEGLEPGIYILSNGQHLLKTSK